MAQKKAYEVDAWLSRPDRAHAIVLIYGPDRGLVAERARAFAVATGLPLDDPFSVVRLDASEIERDQGRLLDEARTVPMFSARRLLWVRNASRPEEPRRRGQGALRRSAARRHRPDRGGRAEEGRAAARRGRGERHRHGAALLCRRGQGHRRGDRRRAWQGRHDADAGGPPGAAPQPRRRPAGLARRDRQAGALCPWTQGDRPRRRPGDDRRRFGRCRSTTPSIWCWMAGSTSSTRCSRAIR